MKRTFATLGVVGLAMLSVTAPASAADNFTLCHNGHAISIDLSGVNGLGAHSGHQRDIIPPNDLLPAGLNWDVQGMADFENNCDAVTLPVVVPPVVVPPVVVPPVVVPPAVDPPVVVPPVVVPPAVTETPVTETPVTLTPAAQTPVPQAAAPQGAAAKAPAAVSKGTNQGFNAQTAIGGADESTTWLAGLGVLLGAGTVVAVRRKSRTESPTAG